MVTVPTMGRSFIAAADDPGSLRLEPISRDEAAQQAQENEVTVKVPS
jgi:hypothetical protein